MKLRVNTVISTAAALAATASVFAAVISTSAAPKAAAGPFVCPVTGQKIATAKDAFNSEVYKGKTYYFCCADCKPQFDKNPAKFIKTAAKK